MLIREEVLMSWTELHGTVSGLSNSTIISDLGLVDKGRSSH